MPGVIKIKHKGTEILLVDYRGCENDREMIEVLHSAQKVVINDNREYLQLIDFRGNFATSVYMNEAKKVARETPKLARKRAIAGIDSSAKKILLQIYNMIIGKKGLKPFDTLEEAKDWLITD